LIEDTFVITGRGLVIGGQILDGTLRIGSRVVLPDSSGGERIERVTGVETGHRKNDDGSYRAFVGLLIGELPESEITGMRQWLNSGDKLNVEDPEPGYKTPQWRPQRRKDA
jgi:translation elongation factor EF-Tu-like GTPase